MYDIAYVIKGSLRKPILEAIKNKPKTAKQLGKVLNKHIQSVSRTLLDLDKKGLVECLNPRDDRFRFYKITPKGKELLLKASEII